MSTPPFGLSVVMITRNADKYLERSLTALSAIADETVVVDTGSTDDTVRIAHDMGCSVFSIPWKCNFSQAKNYAVEKARFPWILNVDSDEVLETEDAGTILKKAMTEAETPAYAIYLDNYLSNGIMKSCKAPRLFRNDSKIRFTNPVHESICETLFSNWPNFELATLDIHLRHYGYLEENLSEKFARNIAILEQWVAEEPLHIYANYKLGCHLFETGHVDNALRHLGKVLEFFKSPECRRVHSLFLTEFIFIYHNALDTADRAELKKEFEQLAEKWLKELALPVTSTQPRRRDFPVPDRLRFDIGLVVEKLQQDSYLLTGYSIHESMKISKRLYDSLHFFDGRKSNAEACAQIRERLKASVSEEVITALYQSGILKG